MNMNHKDQSTRIVRCLDTRAVLGLGMLILWQTLAQAATVTLQQGVTPRVGGGTYQGTTDSWLDESAGSQDDNYGASHELRIGYDQTLGGGGFADDHTVLKFELPSLTFSSVNGATLELFYFEARDFQDDNVLGIKPYRIHPEKWWYENNGGPGGKDNEGVNYLYRDQNQTLPWTGPGAWNDKIDDGNGTNLLKRTGGSVPGPIEPGNWVPLNVQPSVVQWYGGATNNGFGIFSCWFQGGGNYLWARFASRDTNNPVYRPKLTIGYQGANISWLGAVNCNWDTNTLNWNVGGYHGRFGSGDYVLFTDGAANTSITVTSAGVAPASVVISNNATTYSFSGGSIGGSGGLTKRGPGQVTLANSNTYNGPTLVQEGQIIVAANNALGGTGSGTTVSEGAALGLHTVNYTAPEPLTLAGSGIGMGALYTVSGANTFGGAITLVGHSTIGVPSGSTLTLTNTIAGSHDLAKTGPGTLTFAGAIGNTYAGATYVNQGTLVLAKSTGEAVPGPLFIGDGLAGATVQLQQHGQLGIGDIVVRTGSLLDLNNFNSRITGNLVLSNATVLTGTGTLVIGGSISTAGAQTNIISGRLDLDGAIGVFTVADGAAVDDLVVSAGITNGGLSKTGLGRLVLSGDNSFNGELRVVQGLVAIAAPTALGSTAAGTIVYDGARLELRQSVGLAEPLLINGTGGGLGALYSAATGAFGLNSWAGPITLGSASAIGAGTTAPLTLNGQIDAAGFDLSFYANDNVTVSGPISGSGSTVIKFGPGTLTFTGSTPNTYSGSTVVSMGQLILAKPGAVSVPGQLVIGALLSPATVTCQADGQFGPGATATVNAGSLLNLNGFNARLAGLTLNDGTVETGTGTLQLAGPLACMGVASAWLNGNLTLLGPQEINVKAGCTLNLGAATTGGGFNKLGAGTLVLTNINNFNDPCVVNEGSVLVNNNPAAGFGLGPGPVNVTGRAVLGGSGSINGPVTIGDGGVLSPGASLGELIISNNLVLGTGSQTRIEVGGPAPAIDMINLRQGGIVSIAPGAQLLLTGMLEGTDPYIFIRGAQNVVGTFIDLPEGADVPGQPGWYIHYGTHRVYFSQVQQPIVYFRAFSTNGVVLVMWRTGEEIETKWFDLYQRAGPDWLKVNDEPIEAKNPAGAVYFLVDPYAYWNQDYQFKLVAHTTDGEESWLFDRHVTEFRFSALPKLVEDGVELHWLSRTDETYDLEWTDDIGQPLVPVVTNVPATPPECVVIHHVTNSQGYYRVRMVP